MKKVLNLFIGLLFVVIATSSYAQHTVSIEASVTEACAPANITFTPTVTNCSGTVTYYWLADTGDDSTDEMPTFSYISGNTYTVSLEVQCDGVPVTETIEIAIYDPPTAAIDETPIELCTGESAPFINASTQGSGAITDYIWYFGDGNSSTDENPVHTYGSSSVFNVSLIVTDENGCTDEFTSSGLASVANPPVVSFTADEPFWCQANHDVTFTADVSTDLSLGYTLEWDFGDGSPLGSTSPVTNNYGADGLYDVSLTATDDFGCETTALYPDFVQIATPTADYSVLGGLIVCKDQGVEFQNETSYDCSWDFGDGSPISTNPVPNHTYHISGDFVVIFTIDPGGVCETDTQFTITVEEVSAEIFTNPEAADLNACNSIDVFFTSTTSGNVTEYFWNFGDSSTPSEEANPNHTYNTPGGPYTPILTVVTDNGCAFSAIGPPVFITVPDASFIGDTIEGCEPFEIDFTHTGVTPASDITNYSWDFDNGFTEPDGGAEESSTFDEGEYTVSLTIIDDNGCVGTSTLDIIIGTVPDLIYDLFDNDEDHTPLPDHYVCAQDTLALWLQEWDLDEHEFTWLIDSSQNEDVSEAYTEYAFDQDTGWFHVNIISEYNGCIDTIYWDSIYVDGPIIKSIGYDTECSTPLDFVFTLDTVLAETWDWEFYYYTGSTRTDVEIALASTEDVYPITFPLQQSYWCKVTAYNSSTGCEFVDSIEVSISAPQAIFTLLDDEECANDPIILNGGSSLNVTQYHWDFGDGTNSGWITESAVQHIWTDPGYFTITLTVKDDNDCETFITDEIHILGPQIEIIADQTFGCNSLTVHFQQDIAADEAVPTIIWDFLNGDQEYGNDVYYTFDEPGTYSFTVFAQTVSGCMDDTTYVDYITVAAVSPAFSAPIQIACIGDELSFNATDETDPTYTYTWNFGDGGGDIPGNDFNTTHTYAAGGYFDVSLHVDNMIGCTDQLEYESYIVIQDPTADFTLVESFEACYPVEPQIVQNSSTIPPDALLYAWDMGDGSDIISIEDPICLYTAPGAYTIELTIETSAGCTDTHSEVLTVDGPFADYIIPEEACIDEPVSFSMTNQQSVDSYQWVVGGGASYVLESFDHVYSSIPPEGFYPITLTLTSGTCVVPLVENIYIYDAYAGIQITNPDLEVITGDCAPFDALLNSDADEPGMDWFVDGEEYGNHLVSEPITLENTTAFDITVEIELAIVDSHGCTDTATTTIEVWAIPQVGLADSDIICFGDQLGIWVSGGTSYIWSPNYQISDINSATPYISPEVDTMYTVQVFNEHCNALDSVYIQVMQPPNVTLSPEIDTIMIGDTVYTLLIADSDSLSFTWTPDIYISCTDCPMPFFVPEEDIRYDLLVEDTAGCFKHHYYVDIIVNEEYSLDVPMAFTPLGNADNQVVYVKGFGIKKLLQFRIFNRWGEEVFYTDDINQGWNGYYKGQIQNIDNYSYYVEAEMWDGSIRTKKGYIMLIR